MDCSIQELPEDNSTVVATHHSALGKSAICWENVCFNDLKHIVLAIDPNAEVLCMMCVMERHTIIC